jgi:ubiquinone/menaquinone biosynthesis C-methylase UbiE
MRVGMQNEHTRETWLKNVLEKIPAGYRILDAGAGEQAYKKFCDHLKYVAQDFAQYDGIGDDRGLQTGTWDYSELDIISDITAIPEPDAAFDAIMCIEVLEHLPEPLKALSEFSRLLRNDGHLIITAPFCSLTHFAPYHYYSGFNRYFYEFHLEEHGFKIVDIQENGNFFEYLAQEIRRVPSIAEQYSGDKLSRRERIASKVVINMLERFSKQDHGSEEILHFGFQVHAVKLNKA